MKIEVIVGNIVEQPDVEALVNSANANLRLGSGVAGAIHTAAGPALEEFCKPFAPIELGARLVADIDLAAGKLDDHRRSRGEDMRLSRHPVLVAADDAVALSVEIGGPHAFLQIFEEGQYDCDRIRRRCR